MSILDCREQSRALAHLQMAQRTGRQAHGMIFHGPEGVGKGLLARRWGQLQLCAAPVAVQRPVDMGPASWPTALDEMTDSCGKCPDCRLVQGQTHPDLHVVTKDLIRHARQGRERKMISLPIDVIREFVIEPAGKHPNRGRAQMFIIEGTEEMKWAAQNALLKILEEPPERTFLILVTSMVDRLLPTVQSRCQWISFGALPIDFVRSRLLEAGQGEAQANYWADFSEGRLGLALRLARMDLYGQKRELVEHLADLGPSSALSVAKWMVEQAKGYAKAYLEEFPGYSQSSGVRQGYGFFLGVIGHVFRQALRSGVAAAAAGPVDQADAVAKIGRCFGPRGCAEAICATWRAQARLEANVNATLIFETLLLQYIDCSRRSAGMAQAC